MAYFRKELPRRTLFLPNGSAIPVQILDDSVGIIQTTDPETLKFLAGVVGTQGVSEISASEADNLKKKIRLSNIERQIRTTASRPKSISLDTPKVAPRKGCGACGGRRNA
jgi:hypothetical protein